ncbi:hypothetical protein BH20ACT22_BH20ACT22_11350 [soil metagenome]
MTGEVIRRALELEGEGEAYAVATVVRVDRPVSARPGDSALITRDGRLEGWVGGSCAEPVVVREALAALAGGAPKLLRIRPVGSPREPAEPGVVTEVTTCASEGGLDVFVEPHLPAPRLAVAGSSPTARKMVRLAKILGYRVTAVLDDPAECLPGADATIGCRALAADDLGPEDAVVVAKMSRYDDEAVDAALKSGAGYVGLVASRSRGAHVLGLLRSRGLPEEQLARVRTPAGIDLGPSTQDEIALAVLTEMVAHRTRRAAGGVDRLCAPSEQITAIDPVCGMEVALAESTLSATRLGATAHFCSPNCRKVWLQEARPASGT